MKLTAILLLIGCLQVSANGFAQGKITMRKTNATLEEVLLEINKQTGVLYSVNGETLKKAVPIDINVKNEDLQKVLGICFAGQPLTYTFKENIIIVKEKVAPVKVRIEDEINPIDVRGKVTDEKGNPVQGVTVTIKGTEKLTLTDENGEFSLSSIDKEAVLVFTSVNMEMFEVKVNGQAELMVKLRAKVSEMSEIVVSTGYQDIPKERATGSFTLVDRKLLNRIVSSDVIGRLKGIVPGMLFDRSSDNSLGVSIRGRSTINASSQPLIIVDNFQYNGNLNNINPNDIESITILKDAAAASIWGAQSGNGVIVITTKKGKYGQPVRVNFNSNVTVRKRPDLKYDQGFLPSTAYIDVERYLYDKGFYQDYINNKVEYPVLSPVVEILEKIKNQEISSQAGEDMINQLKKGDIRNDYSDYLYRTAINQTYSLGFSGGGERSSYYMSAGYDKNLTNVVGNSGDRKTFTVNMSFLPIKNLEVTGGAYYSQSDAKNNAINNVIVGGRYATEFPYMRLVDDNGKPIDVPKDYNSGFVKNPPVSGLLSYRYNPLQERAYLDNRSISTENRITGSIRYTFLKGFSAELKYQRLKVVSEGKETQDERSYSVRNLINQFAIISNNESTGSNIPYGGILVLSNGSTKSENGRFLLRYTKDWNNHSVNFIGGVDVTEIKTEGNVSTVYGYNPQTGASAAVDYNSLYNRYPTGSGQIPGRPIIIPYTIDRFRSFFANGSYSFSNKYTVSGSARIDQSNLFGVKSNQRMVPLWSAGLKWDIDKESFYALSWLPVLKLRATYGYQGNVNKSITAFTTAIVEGTDALNNLNYSTIRQPGNPNLKWERNAMFNVGLDFGFPKSIVSGSFEFFKKKGFDLIGDANLPSSTGFNSATGNYSNMKGSGVEATIVTKNIDRTVKWSTSFLFTWVTDKITKNEGMTEYYPGRPVKVIASYKWGGLNAEGDPLGYLDDTLSKDYTAISQQYTNSRKLFIIHNASPQIFGSIMNIFEWKNISLSFNFIYKAKYYYRKSHLSYSSLFNQGVGHADFDLRWQKKGDESHTDVPAMVYIDYPQFEARSSFYSNSSATIERGDHIRLQDISLSFDIQKNRLKKMPLNNLRFYMYASDLGIVWSSDKNIDPDNLSQKPSPSIAFGLAVGF